MASRKPLYLDFENGEINEFDTGDTVDTSVATNVGGVGAGSGDVVGPGSATANAIALFDGTTGKLIKDSTKVVTDFQPVDSDLTAIAAISPSNDDIIQRKAGAWANRTCSQVKTDLSLVKADVGLGNVDNTSDANKPVSTATQTALNLKQDSLGYTAENTANKATNWEVVNGTLYPSVSLTEARYIPLSTGIQNLAIGLSNNTDQTIASGFGIVVPDEYEIGNSTAVEISSNSILMII